MFKYKLKLSLIYLLVPLFVFVINIEQSFAGFACTDPECQNIDDCNEDEDCEDCRWCNDTMECIDDSSGCPPPPGISEVKFSQVGGIARGNPSADWCCAFFANECAPCGNPALGYSYQVPSACDDATTYANLWVRCKDEDCSGITQGGYEVRVCHYNAQDPSDTGTETCGDPCLLNSIYNNCNADLGVGAVQEGEMIYIRIHPKYSPDAPFNGLWSALVEECQDNSVDEM